MADTGSDEALQKYSEVLERLNSALYQRELHVEREQLAKQLGIAEEIEQARQVKSQYLALSTGACPIKQTCRVPLS